jgi:hypothetical protein
MTTNDTTTKNATPALAEARLRDLAVTIPIDLAADVVVCEYSAEDATPTLHVHLWRGKDLSDLPAELLKLSVVAEGHWDGGRCYSLQA